MNVKKIIGLLFLIAPFTPLSAQTAQEKFTVEANAFLQRYVSDGSVDYANIKKNFPEIESLYKQVGQMNLNNAADQEKKAFYINAYNLVVIYQVTKYYPLKSALDASGFFDQIKHRVAGEELTLNGLEIGKLLKRSAAQPYGDARVHFVLACAAKGCPKLAGFTFQPDKLDAQLEDRAKLALNNSYFIRVNKGQKKVEVSKIFTWYEKDFTGGGKSVLAYINQYRQEKIPIDYQVSNYEYDWSLNSK